MSKQIKGIKIDEFRKMKNRVVELEYLYKIKESSCRILNDENKLLKYKLNNKIEYLEKLERENDTLRAENYSLKHKKIFKFLKNILLKA